jgi:hypothetical protein
MKSVSDPALPWRNKTWIASSQESWNAKGDAGKAEIVPRSRQPFSNGLTLGFLLYILDVYTL